MSAPSLAALFAPPDDDHVGDFGWLCGYSADAAFLDTAVERFTRLTRGQRGFEGRIWLVALLDGGCSRPLPVDAPGVLAPALVGEERPWARLLHAKVAWLGFRRLDGRGQHLRLVISTGNWTEQTLHESLDLAWSLDLGERERVGQKRDRRSCADLAEARRLLGEVRGAFDLRLLELSAGPVGVQARSARERLDTALAEAAAGARGRARVVHNLDDPLYKGIIKGARATGGGARNRLVLGSGFYEGGRGEKVPGVLDRLANRLRRKGLLTKNAGVHLVVNPQQCGRVATATAALRKRGWAVHAAADPDPRLSRSLHAKFALGAGRRSNSERCLDAWLYLGSGNLTGPGLEQRADRGNLEVGAVLEPAELRWEELSAHLPVELDSDDLSGVPGVLSAGQPLPERPPADPACPVGWLLWEEEGGLVVPEVFEIPAGFEVLRGDERPCRRRGRRLQWSREAPLHLRVRWKAGEGAVATACVPVLDALGRVSARPPPPVGFDEIGGILAAFPLPPDDDPDEPGSPGEQPSDGGGPEGPGERPSDGGGPDPAALRTMMTLVETIGRLQVGVEEHQWAAWLVRLEQTLVRARQEPAVHGVRAVGIDPLDALLAPPFRPPYAGGSQTEAGRAYEAAVGRIREAWGLAGLPGLLGSEGTA